jgi:cell division transport system permease protein
MSVKTVRRRVRALVRRQFYSLFSSLGTLWGHRLGTLMTVLVLGIAMALPLGLHVTLQNMRSLDLNQDEWGTITVFLNSEADEAGAAEFARRVNSRGDASAVLISPEQGMEDFRDASGFGQALDLFETNPIPWTLLVTPQVAESEDLGGRAALIASWLGEQNVVDLVQVDYKWMQRLSGLLGVGNALATVLTIMFSLAVVVVIANTIRLDVANRSEEIQVLSLVGANDGFIRQPFLYAGFWYGLLGAVLALLLLSLSILYLNKPLERLLSAYGNSFEMDGLSGSQIMLVILSGGVLGFCGAWLSVQRYLRQMRVAGKIGKT